MHATFMLITHPNGTSATIDFREMAPKAANRDMLNHDLLLVQVGGLAVSVPGEVSGFELAHRALRKSKMAGVVSRHDRTQRSRIPSDLET